MGGNQSCTHSESSGRSSGGGTSTLESFDITPRTRLVFGAGAIDRLPGVLDGIGCDRVLVVTDGGIVRAGHVERVMKALGGEGRRLVEVFSGVRENPDTVCVNECLAVARGFRPDVLIGLGGGSSMDTAKGCNFLLTNGGRMQDYWGVGKATRPMLPFVAIPTTAGTGSECQSAALIADAATHMKMACLDPKAAARAAILDPELTVSQPAGVTACTGIDAIAHAVETAVTTKRNPLSLMHSRQAFALLASGFPVVLADPTDLDARGRMLLGAALAGTAIEQSMLGAAHSAANPLTAHFGVIHGMAVGVMLPHVVRHNARSGGVRRLYVELASAAGWVGRGDAEGEVVEGLATRLEGWLEAAGIPRGLKEHGVEPGSIPTLAEEAARQWTAGFNPVAVTAEDFRGLYGAAMG